MTQFKDLLLDVVPPLQEPPDRLAAIRRRATARRRMSMTGTALAALASAVTLGTTMAVLTPAGPATQIAVGPAPSSSEPQSLYQGPYRSEPPKDFPMPGPGICPASVQFLHMPTVDAYPGGTLPEISGVTLCRYTHSDYDLGAGEIALRSGPGTGDVNTFRDAFTRATLPYPLVSSSGGPPPASGSPSGTPSVSASSSCSPGPKTPPPWTIDVMFVHSPGGITRAVYLHRYKCDPPLTDPMAAVWIAVDAKLGRPY